MYNFLKVADLVVCSVWLLLLTHDSISGGMINPLSMLFPALRIWLVFLMNRRSKLMIAPLAMLSLLGLTIFGIRESGIALFVVPSVKFLTSAAALFGVKLIPNADYQDFITDVHECILPINLICYAWMVVVPLGIFLYHLCKRQLVSGRLSVWKAIALCVYVLVVTFADTVILSETYKNVLSVTILSLMLLPIPLIFYRRDIKELFNRNEIAYLLTFAIFAVGYICGIGLELKTAFTVSVLPAAFFALANWYVRRETTYKDVMLIVGASMVFWCAQYTTNMVRIILLIASLALIAIPVIRFAIDTKKNWTSAGVYIIVALIMPTFCLGYNQYSVLDAKREWHFNKYIWSQNGLLCVSKGNVGGLRDRYGVILPFEYNRIELLEPSKPYCKVRKDGMWQIFDIERHELVSDERFEEVIPCDDNVCRLKSQNGDKYLIMPSYYNRYDKEQSAVISDKLPVKKDEE